MIQFAICPFINSLFSYNTTLNTLITNTLKTQATLPSLKQNPGVFDVDIKWPIFIKSAKEKEETQHIRPILDPLVPLITIRRTKPMVLLSKNRVYIRTELSWKPEIV